MPPSLIGCAKDLQNPKAWIDAVFAYWGNDSSGFTPMGKRGVDVFREVFARSFVVAPLISAQLADQEVRRLVLTKDQIRVLDFLRSHRRVAVSGGAGTGAGRFATSRMNSRARLSPRMTMPTDLWN